MKATVGEDGLSVEIQMSESDLRERRVVVDSRPDFERGGHVFVFRLLSEEEYDRRFPAVDARTR